MSKQMDWISWFCSKEENDFFCKVDINYIEDRSNLDGLKDQVPYYYQALTVISGSAPDEDDDNSNSAYSQLKCAIEMLYGLIHARYINSSNGIDAMINKYMKGVFGQCPRVFCQEQDMLPVGISSIPKKACVCCFCPKCSDYYIPRQFRHEQIDGAYFANFPDNFFLAKPFLRPERLLTQGYQARLFGFKIHPSAYIYQAEKAAKFGKEDNNNAFCLDTK